MLCPDQETATRVQPIRVLSIRRGHSCHAETGVAKPVATWRNSCYNPPSLLPRLPPDDRVDLDSHHDSRSAVPVPAHGAAEVPEGADVDDRVDLHALRHRHAGGDRLHPGPAEDRRVPDAVARPG